MIYFMNVSLFLDKRITSLTKLIRKYKKTNGIKSTSNIATATKTRHRRQGKIGRCIFHPLNIFGLR